MEHPLDLGYRSGNLVRARRFGPLIDSDLGGLVGGLRHFVRHVVDGFVRHDRIVVRQYLNQPGRLKSLDHPEF